MLRSSSSKLWVCSPLLRNPAVPFRPIIPKVNNIVTTYSQSSFKLVPHNVRSYASQAFPPRSSSRKWKWLLPPVLVGAALYLSSDDKTDERFDAQKLYAHKSTSEIAFSWLILKLCSYEFIVHYGPKLLHWAEENHLGDIATFIMKQTFFRHFVAGETLEETGSVSNHLLNEGMGVILDYSIEAGSGTTQELDNIAQGILATVTAVAHDPTPFACLKVSGLTSFALLLRLSDIISHNNKSSNTPPLELTGEKALVPYLPRVLPPSPSSPNPSPLSHAEKLELAELVARLDIICRESAKNNVSILFDAEQTYYQPAIDFLAIHFSNKYNKETPIIYNTYQMYLKDGPARLQTDIENAKKQGFLLGVKLVRGAYLHGEKKRALAMNYADPIAENIDATHANYYKGLELAFANISDIGLMIASHNEDTVIRTIDRLKELGLDTKTSRLQFAQLYGMGDHLSAFLVQNGIRVSKYVPFGPVEHVIPYLVRRMQENRGFIGSASSTERALLWKELKRRLLWFTSSDNNKKTSATAVISPPRGAL